MKLFYSGCMGLFLRAVTGHSYQEIRGRSYGSLDTKFVCEFAP